MKRYVIQGSFGLENLVTVDAPEPRPGLGQSLLRMKAASLNYRDWMLIQGQYSPSRPLPITPLSDGVGEVTEVGEGVTRVKAGDRVCPTFFQKWIKGAPTREELRSTLGSPLDGTFTEWMVVDEEGIVPAPHI